MKQFIGGLCLAVLLMAQPVQAATYGQFIEFGPYFSGGNLVANTKVYHSSAGTDTTKNCWSDRDKATPVADPLVLDSQGVGGMYCDGLYRFTVKTSGGSTLYTFDYVAISDQTQTAIGEGAAITSASTLVLGTDGDFFHVTGTTTINAISGTQTSVILAFDSALTLTHSGTIILNSSTNLITSSGVVLGLVNEGSGVWRELFRSTPQALPIGANGTVLTADSTVSAGASWQVTGFTTGDVKLTLKSAADTGWVLMDDKTIGDASSSATGRANADTSTLYALIWTNCIDTWCAVTGGRGGSAAADFAAHKPIALPKTLGRALAGYGTGTVTDSGGNADVDTGAANSLTVPSNNTKWITGMPVVFTLASGTITGLTSSTTYYVIRNSSTLIKLASTLALAQAGTEIDLTAKSSPVWTITHTYTARVMGEAVGEESHAMSLTELLSHSHTTQNYDIPAGGVAFAGGGGQGNAGSGTNATGGNAAMNNLQPTLFLNVMVKL